MTDQTELERLKAEMDAAWEAAWVAWEAADAAEAAYEALEAEIEAGPKCKRCGDTGWLDGDPVRGISDEPCGCDENWEE